MKRSSVRKLNWNPGLVALVFSAILSGISGAEPELRIVREEGSARSNRPYQIQCEVTWSGEASEYAIQPAEFDPIDWGTMTVTGITGSVKDGQNVVTQDIVVFPAKVGTYDVPAIRVPYLNPEATPPAEKAAARTDPPASSASPSLRAEPFRLDVRPARISFWISGGLGASLLLLLTVIGWRVASHLRRKRQPISVSGAGSRRSDYESTHAFLHAARQRRLDGRFYEYYQELAHAAETLPDAGALAASLHARAQEVGYRGVRPTDDELDISFRDVERALARSKEDQEA